mmetsp:Transcript_94450/g.240337  ORF Transcript_94450/g.240337 Transcript_94450/m.240337 type:complete len:99 (-) Transcript_94450:255-551(-)
METLAVTYINSRRQAVREEEEEQRDQARNLPEPLVEFAMCVGVVGIEPENAVNGTLKATTRATTTQAKQRSPPSRRRSPARTSAVRLERRVSSTAVGC